MPIVRSYVQVTSVDASDAILLDRVGSGTVFIKAENLGLNSVPNWNNLTNVPVTISAIANGGSASAGTIFEYTGASTGHFINTPNFVQNFNYSALTSVPNAVNALSSLTPAAGQIVEYTAAGTAHMIPTPSGGGGGGPAVPGTTHIGSLVTWNSLTGAAIADPNVIPSANGYSLISSSTYASMRGLLGIGSVGLLNDLSSILTAGSGISVNTISGVTTIAATGSTLTPNTWNPSDKSADITLSAGNETATLNAGPGSEGIRGTVGKSSGKVYLEYTVTPSSLGDVNVGLADIALPLNQTPGSSGSGPGNLGFSISDAGLAKANNAVAIAGGWTGGPRTFTWQIAIDLTNLLVWAKPSLGTGSTTWNNSGTANPATGVGGFPYNAISVGYTFASMFRATNVTTVNTGATSFAGTIPLGFTAWDSLIGLPGVVSVNGRAGAVTLTAADVATNFGSEMNSKLVAGTGVSTSYNAGTDQLTINATGTSGVATFNGRSGAVALGASDLSPLLSAGLGIGLNTISGTVNISTDLIQYHIFTGIQFDIRPSNSATTNTTNLNNLINALFGGGTILLTESGAYQINDSIVLRPRVSIEMPGNSWLAWVGSTSGGSAGGSIVTTLVTEVFFFARIQLNISEGGGFTGICLLVHSTYNCQFDILGLGAQTINGTFVLLTADSTANPLGFENTNIVFNKFRLQHNGQVGTFLRTQGTATGFGGNPQVVTLNNFEDLQGRDCSIRGIKLDSWTDSNEFSGQTRMNMTGLNAVGVVVNELRGVQSVYNNHWCHLAIDTFGSGLNRVGVILYESKGHTCDQFFQGPTAEGGDLIGTPATSYQFRQLVTTTGIPAGSTADHIVYRQKGIDPPTL